MTPENPISELIVKYKPLQEKYQLPEFSKMNELFDIEDIDPETEFLLRKVRRTISEKIANYIRFIEIILNPSNAPMYFFKLLKKLDSEDKESLSKLYESLGNTELKMLSLDLDYNEDNEAKFIKENYNTLQKEIKEEFSKVIEKLNNGEENSAKLDSSYLG